VARRPNGGKPEFSAQTLSRTDVEISAVPASRIAASAADPIVIGPKAKQSAGGHE
jgi:hypothetical protein